MLFELAGPSDDAALRRLLRETPMAGDIRLSMEREPSIELANGIEGERTDILVGRTAPSAAPVAMGACTTLTSFVNGLPRRVGYLGQLRITSEFRGRAGVLRSGYRALRRLAGNNPDVNLFVTTIVADNLAARRVLEAAMPGLPKYRHIGDVLSLTLSTRRPAPGRSRGIVSSANAGDIDALTECLARYGAQFQFAPHWTAADLSSAERMRGLALEDFLVVRRGSQIVGCLACWDQRAFKQLVVRGYSWRMRLLRPLWNAVAPLARAPVLPRPGSPLAVVFLSHLAVDNNDIEVFKALLEAGLERAAGRGATHAVLGLSDRNAFMDAVLGYRPRVYRSRAYLVCWPEVEAAAARLDARPLHLEVAIL